MSKEMEKENIEEVVEEVVEEVQEEVEEIEEVEEVTPEQQIQKLEAEVTSWKTEYYKVYADMENVKRRMQTEHSNALKFMLQGVIEDLLPVVDNFERANNLESNNDEILKFLKGYQMIQQQLMSVLEKQGVSVIETKDQDFDPNFHQAVMSVNDENFESNKIVEELQKGYLLKDRVIRASLVKVNQ